MEADAIGKLVGIDFLINFVVDRDGYPIKAFSGSCDAAFESCVRYGEEKVWGTKVDKNYDITILASGDEEAMGLEDNPTYYLGLGLGVTKEAGTVIMLIDDTVATTRHIIDGIDIDELSVSELLLLHERRTWNCSDRQVQHYIKALRGSWYMRRNMILHKQNLYIVAGSFSASKIERYRAEHFADMNEALAKAKTLYDDPDILVIPNGKKTYPILEYSYS
jgi:hypothetical protein